MRVTQSTTGFAVALRNSESKKGYLQSLISLVSTTNISILDIFDKLCPDHPHSYPEYTHIYFKIRIGILFITFKKNLFEHF